MKVSRHSSLRRVAFIVGAIFLAIPVPAQTFSGYTLYAPSASPARSYLVNMSNTIVKTWSHTVGGAYSCYLLPDGTLLRSAAYGSGLNGGGATGMVQKVSWAGTVTWQYTYSTTSYRSHHDIEPMPNGNVLLIAWEVKTAAQCVAAGLNHSVSLWPDHIVEIQPVGSSGGNIVWQWHAWDHLVQDYDATKANYGVVGSHPELLDINYGSSMSGDWMHLNGISYNATLDQIAVSSHNLNEVYVIDHSTTTAEAATHSGGRRGRGGDFLYRWGNPAAYRASGTRVFDVVHCAWWVPDSLPGGGHLMAFNNRSSSSTSMIVELIPPVDSVGNYVWTPGTAYGPGAPTWSFTASGFYSQHLGGVQRLPNGNTLIAQSLNGKIFEVTSAGTVVWTYQPGGEIIRALRYPLDYSGVLLTGVTEQSSEQPGEFSLAQNYPNPFNPTTTIAFSLSRDCPVTLEVYTMLGELVATPVHGDRRKGSYSVSFDASGIPSGVYVYRLTAGNSVASRKLVVLK